jgi:hypothetical protein
MSLQCQSVILDILLTCDEMSVVWIMKKNGYLKIWYLNGSKNSLTYGL